MGPRPGIDTRFFAPVQIDRDDLYLVHVAVTVLFSRDKFSGEFEN